MTKPEVKTIKVALVGNPNSGKSSIFNALVGANQKVANWPGVTIEKCEGSITYSGYKLHFIDLPGTYSLTAYSPEEVISRNYIINEKIDVIIDVVDGTNLERHLYLTTQLMELETNMIIALNMFDEVKKKGIRIHCNELERLLGSHIIPTVGVKKKGMNSVYDHIIHVYNKQISIAKNKIFFRPELEERISKISKILETESQLSTSYHSRWLAIKLLENDRIVYKLVQSFPIWLKVESILLESIDTFKKLYDSDAEMALIEDRHAFIYGAFRETVVQQEVVKSTFTDYIDAVVLNRIVGLPIFLIIMWLVFQFTFTLGAPLMHWMDLFFQWVSMLLAQVLPTGFIQSIVLDGIIGGVGGVLIFLPNILLLFIALSILEGTGYMSRAAFVIDKLMHLFGLHGKSFIPMITGFGCSIPAVMATRILKNRGDRLTTMMIIPFMSCGAKLPVYVLLIGAFFSPRMAGNVLFGIYIFGALVGLLTAKLLKSTFFKGESEPFVMELPPYRLPMPRSVLIQSKQKAKMYLKKAGTVILAASLLIWVASNYPVNPTFNSQYHVNVQKIEANETLPTEIKNTLITMYNQERIHKQMEYSIAGRVGKLIEPVIRPLGFDWRIGIALTTGLAAKEVVVSTLGTIYSIGLEDKTGADLSERLKEDPTFTSATGLSLMIFVLLYIPCLATLAVFKKEAGSWKWVGLYSAYALFVAWILSFITYRIASLFLS